MTSKGNRVPQPYDADRVGRMEFMLTLRRRGISDQAVLRAMDEVPREHFVVPDCLEAAYGDHALPIACGQTISQPYVVAYMTEQLALKPQHRVLEVGTGSGYQAAVLSRLAREDRAPQALRALAEEWERTERHAATLLRDQKLLAALAAAEEVPPALVEQLAEGGVMLLPLGPQAGTQEIVKLTKTNEGLGREHLIGVRFVPLLPGQAREL